MYILTSHFFLLGAKNILSGEVTLSICFRLPSEKGPIKRGLLYEGIPLRNGFSVKNHKQEVTQVFPYINVHPFLNNSSIIQFCIGICIFDDTA